MNYHSSHLITINGFFLMTMIVESTGTIFFYVFGVPQANLVGGLEVWNMTFMTFHMLGMQCHPNWRTHAIIFQRGRSTTNQLYRSIKSILRYKISPSKTHFFSSYCSLYDYHRSTANQKFKWMEFWSWNTLTVSSHHTWEIPDRYTRRWIIAGESSNSMGGFSPCHVW